MLLGERKKRVPIGYENFKEIIDNKFYYIDKTMLIYDLIDNGGKTNLITRPRRFGKTLNFSMLRYFFDITEKDNAYLFDGLKISQYNDMTSSYRNAFPVISLSMKCGKQGNYENAVSCLCDEIRDQFKRFRYILDSDKLDETGKIKFERLLNSEPDAGLFGQSIKFLSQCLKDYYGRSCVILIDEYDVPLEDAYFSGYYDKMVIFIRSLFESALKTNDALAFAVITGCLRISKESIFTGLNNLRINTILDRRYSEHFGFEEYEVMDMLRYYDLEHKFEEAKKWYDGYMFGNTEVYNPWSIVNYVQDMREDEEAIPSADWVNTSSNNIVRYLVENSDRETRNDIEKLISGGEVVTVINETTTYGDLRSTDENIWSFLFFTGYLRVRKTIRGNSELGEETRYALIIPNIEVKMCYVKIVSSYFERFRRKFDRDSLFKALLERDAEGISNQITGLLQKSISFYDGSESFYHGLLAGLITPDIYYSMVSNREMGDGRSDIALYQEDRFVTAVIIEIKVCGKNDNIYSRARDAIEQINEKHYDSEAITRGYTNIIKYGIAFKNKQCYTAVE